jgi:hypothetical protein
MFTLSAFSPDSRPKLVEPAATARNQGKAAKGNEAREPTSLPYPLFVRGLLGFLHDYRCNDVRATISGCATALSLSKCSNGKSTIALLGREELFDENSRVVRILFRKEVATLHGLPLRVRSPLPPNTERTSISCIERVEGTTLGP